jgi:hypothetical protein
MTLRRRARGLRLGEEVLVQVPCTIVDSTGTSLPAAGAPVVVGISDQRLLVWLPLTRTARAGRLVGGVGHHRVHRAVIDRQGASTVVRFPLDEGATLVVEAPCHLHPEQLVWALASATAPAGEHPNGEQ